MSVPAALTISAPGSVAGAVSAIWSCPRVMSVTEMSERVLGRKSVMLTSHTGASCTGDDGDCGAKLIR
jgi:hypothetical protein